MNKSQLSNHENKLSYNINASPMTYLILIYRIRTAKLAKCIFTTSNVSAVEFVFNNNFSPLTGRNWSNVKVTFSKRGPHLCSLLSLSSLKPFWFRFWQTGVFLSSLLDLKDYNNNNYAAKSHYFVNILIKPIIGKLGFIQPCRLNV